MKFLGENRMIKKIALGRVLVFLGVKGGRLQGFRIECKELES